MRSGSALSTAFRTACCAATGARPACRSHFQILDEDDQQRLVRKIIRELKLDEQRWVPREVQGFINSNKDEGRRAKKLDDRNDPTRQQLIRLYTIYEARCAQAGVVDFAELLLRSFEILRDIPELGDYYRERFRHVLVDEFQDTNGVQYEWLKQLVGKTGAPFVVGDDDQSVYRWRGARVENMQHFKPRVRRDGLPPRAELPLDRRDPRRGQRRHREEHRPHGQGALDRDQGRRADPRLCRLQRARRGRLRDRPHPRARSAAACRSPRPPCSTAATPSRAHSKKSLMAARIPYRVYGGLRFFERAEIKDALRTCA